MPIVHWVYFDLPWWGRFWKKGQRGVHLYYYLWQIGAHLVGKRIHRDVSFDLVHHITFGSYWLPSFLALLPVRFVSGPLGGRESAPASFYRTFGLRGRLYERSRDLARWIGERDPVVRLNIRKSEVMLAKTRETAERMQQFGAREVQIYSESGIGTEEFPKLSVRAVRQAEPFRLVSIGRLLHWKGMHLGLLAFATFHKEFAASEYWVIGEGPERRSLEHLAQKHNIASKLRFWGHLPRQQVLEKLAQCDVLVHPSFHDSGGWVCLEAMTARRPVICLDLGGPALQVTEDTGFKVPAVTPEQVVNDLAEAMHRLAEDPALRTRIGEAGRRRVLEHFDWDKKGEWIKGVYERVFG
jgi:glycosyltransferase involved in cell wall biosynthesis